MAISNRIETSVLHHNPLAQHGKSCADENAACRRFLRTGYTGLAAGAVHGVLAPAANPGRAKSFAITRWGLRLAVVRGIPEHQALPFPDFKTFVTLRHPSDKAHTPALFVADLHRSQHCPIAD